MGRSSRHKEKQENGSELPQSHEGTSARTRPLSYDDIMFKRNNKKLNDNAESIKEGNREVGKTANIHVTEDDFNVNKSDRGHMHGKDFSPGDKKNQREELDKRSSHKKEEKVSGRKDSIPKQKITENPVSGKRLKSEVRIEMAVKDEGKYEKQIHVKRKNDRPTGGPENIDAKKHSRDLPERDRHAGRIEGKYERDSKREHQSRLDDENNGRNSTKKHNSGKGHAFETVERKEKKESMRSHHEVSHHKRRLSRSREREGRHRRSVSQSPRAQKRASHRVSEHEPFSHGLKERSGRQHSDDRGRVTSNGSTCHHRQHGGSTSGLGGYSPRKRKTEVTARMPSPAHCSTEKRTAKWDLAPAEAEKMVSGSVSSNLHASSQTISSNMHAVVSAVPSISITGKPLVVASTSSLSSQHNASFDSVQLTEATRPMRRLYVENIPASASEKVIMESFNNLFLSTGVNHIPRTQPCISCIIHKGKGQALVEFLTPEDASAALSFDGSTFFGSILKVRRPKDFVEVTGEPEKLEATVTRVSDTVKDSHHKIFVGGISKALSSEMFVEIASAFGPLKTYHFVINADHGEQYAILEYVDQSVTLKACAGLNGMKLAGQVITAVQAVPDASSLENGGDLPSCVIPQLARPLLQKPTQVLKLKSLFPEDFSLLSEAAVEEVLEDVRLECARFGTIKSVNIVKHANTIIATGDKNMDDDMKETGARQDLENNEINFELATMEVNDGNAGATAWVKFSSDSYEVTEGNNINDEKPMDKFVDNESCRQDEFEVNIDSEVRNDESLDAEPCLPGGLDSNIAAEDHLDTQMTSEDLASWTVDMTVSEEVPNLINTSEESDYHSDRNADNIQSVDKILSAEENPNPEGVSGKLPEDCPNTEEAVEDLASKAASVTICKEIPRLLNTPKEEPDAQCDLVADSLQDKFINVEKKSVPKEDPELEEVVEKLAEAVDGSEKKSVRKEDPELEEVDEKLAEAVDGYEKKSVPKEDPHLEEDEKLAEALDGSAVRVRIESETTEKDENRKESNLQKIFEPGSVFVEYRRAEASCMAAHCLHGRLFDDRVVTVEYIDPDLYRVKFPK